MRLTFRTRGNASPQGKPRVYYTGHPEDLSLYLDGIAADLLSCQNCAVYYDAEPAADWDREELLRQLEQMQLLVIPVTSRFLFRPSRALEVEFPFAMERHIPVLPLMQESGLEETFNRRCGDLQMLDKNSQDPTALPYEEKLQKFLDSVLVGDELAGKVRAAFDAYVFLSYRKKDRRYAQELMRLIHRNDFCRDIAIWYDEFLMPGENFNQAIAAALEKCSLFALTVTPSIVEKENYVITTEYPEALKAGKPVLPVEMAPTDREALRANFRDLPPCANAREEGALSAALLEAVERLAIRESDGSAQHNFFIGLAYLNGIDVEVDRGRALALITGAAEAGLPEAMEKLVAMYRSGGGVGRDYRAAIEWQEKLVDLHKARYARTQAGEDGMILARALWNLGDYRYDLLAYDSAGDAYQEMRRIAEQLAEKSGCADASRYLFLSYRSTGRVHEADGRLAQAKDDYREALTIWKSLGTKMAEIDIRPFLSGIYADLGRISHEQGQFDQAKEDYLRALEIDRQLSEETGAAEARRNLSITYGNLGRLSESESRFTQAKDYYRKALALRESLCAETAAAAARRDLAACYHDLGDIGKAEGEFSQAGDFYRKALTLRKALSEETGTAAARMDLAKSCDSLGGICIERGQLDQAADYCTQAMEIYRQLADETGSIPARKMLYSSYYRLGTICERRGQNWPAFRYYTDALRICLPLSREVESVSTKAGLANIFERLGTFSLNDGSPAAAKTDYLASLGLREELYEKLQTAQAKVELVSCYNNLACASQAMGQLDQAKDYFRQALDISRQLCQETEGIEVRRAAVRAYRNLGTICSEMGSREEALTYYIPGLELAERLCEQTGMTEDRDHMACLSFYMGRIRSGEEKKRLLTQAYTLWDRLCEECPDQPAFSKGRKKAKYLLDQLEGKA